MMAIAIGFTLFHLSYIVFKYDVMDLYNTEDVQAPERRLKLQTEPSPNADPEPPQTDRESLNGVTDLYNPDNTTASERQKREPEPPRNAEPEPSKTEPQRESSRTSEAPFWSITFARQHRDQSQLSAEERIQWRLPGKDEGNRDITRSATELITYGIGGLMPYFGKILPMLQFDLPITNTTLVKLANVPNLVDAQLDILECNPNNKFVKNSNNTHIKKGFYHACFGVGAVEKGGEDKERLAAYQTCYKKGERRMYETRIRDYSSPGHELWSCSDADVMQQFGSFYLLDFLTYHGDRFYHNKPANNLFFFRDQRPLRFVPLDHHGGAREAFGSRKYVKYITGQYFLMFGIPRELANDLRTVQSMGKENFVRNFNASLDGQLDNLTRLFINNWLLEMGERKSWIRNHLDLEILTNTLWTRFQEVFKVYNTTDGTLLNNAAKSYGKKFL